MSLWGKMKLSYEAMLNKALNDFKVACDNLDADMKSMEDEMETVIDTRVVDAARPSSDTRPRVVFNQPNCELLTYKGLDALEFDFGTDDTGFIEMCGLIRYSLVRFWPVKWVSFTFLTQSPVVEVRVGSHKVILLAHDSSHERLSKLGKTLGEIKAFFEMRGFTVNYVKNEVGNHVITIVISKDLEDEEVDEVRKPDEVQGRDRVTATEQCETEKLNELILKAYEIAKDSLDIDGCSGDVMQSGLEEIQELLDDIARSKKIDDEYRRLNE